MILELCPFTKFSSSFKITPSSSITLNPRLSGLQVSRGENVKRNVFNGNCNRLPRRVSFPSRLRNRIMDRQTGK